MLCLTKAEGCAVQSAPGCLSCRLLDAEYRLGSVVEGSLTVRSLRGVLVATVCLLGVPVALLFQLIVGSSTEIELHLVLGVGFVLTAFAVFDFGRGDGSLGFGCLSIGALGATFLLQGISQAAAHQLAQVLGVSNPWATVRIMAGRRFLGVV
jgi:hypothetical protein